MKAGEVLIGKRLNWKDIKIGQAFLFTGCIGFGIKITHDGWIDLAWSSYDGQRLCYLTGNVTPIKDEGGWQKIGANEGSLWMGPGIFQYYDIPKSLRDCLEPT